MKRGFTTLAILFLLLAASVAIFAYAKFGYQSILTSPTTEPSPDPYGSWKIYQNKTYGFSLRYPEKWFVRQYQDYAADILDTDPKEATPGAVKARFLASDQEADLAEFEKLKKAKVGEAIREVLDAKSTITKVADLKIGNYPAIDFTRDRIFTALEGPRGEYSHIYKIRKEDSILTFQSNAETEAMQKRFDPIITKIFSSIKF